MAVKQPADLGRILKRVLGDVETLKRRMNSVSGEAWRFPTFTNGWSAYDATGDRPPRFYKDATGRVHLAGLLKGGAINTAAFVLPEGYRPRDWATGQQDIYPAIANGAFGGLLISPSGSVVPYIGSAVWFSLDGISFRAEN